jgi:hypothetical protein
MALYPKNRKDFPISKAYKRVGIRRDQNLGDLSSSSLALENLLDSLVVTTGENFIVSDLNSIKNIFARGLEVANYRNIIGSSVKFSTPTGETVAYDPRITYQNRLDKFESFSGTPRLAGGNGLAANYFQNDQINFSSLTSFQYNKSNGNPLDPNLSESNVFLGTTSEGLIKSDNFWEHGEFQYTGKVHPQSVKASGGVMWEGYYIPRTTGRSIFDVSSTGFFTMDFAKEGYFEDNNKNQTPASQAALPPVAGIAQTYTNYMRVGLTTTVTATGGIGNTMAVPVNRIPTIGIGMTVSGSNISGVPKVNGLDRTTGVVTLEPSSGITSSISGTLSGSNNITFSRTFGDDISSQFETQILLAFEKYRIRVRYFHPQVLDNDAILNNQIKNLNKKITIHHQPPGGNVIDNLDFRYLYAIDYDFSDAVKGDFNKYLDKSVLFGGTEIGVGIGDRSNFNEYVRLKSTKKVDLRYKAKENLSKITKVSSRSGSFESGSRIINMDPTSSIEIGNYVFGTNIQPGTRVEQIAINKFLVLNKPAGGSGSQTQNLTFIDHRGFVKKITGTGSGLQITGITTALTASSQSFSTIDTDVQPDMVIIGSNTNSYTKITSVDEGARTLDISRNVTTTATTDYYIYQSRGLKDNSIQQFCDRFNTTTDGPDIRCLVSNVSSTLPIGTTVITVDNTNNYSVIQAGWELQGAYFGANGIAVASVGGSGSITLASGITKPLPDDAQFTAVSPDKDQNGDYQLCCPPTDTSPPFNASEEGLDTISSTAPNMQLVDGNLVFDSLIIQDTNSNASDASASGTVNRKIDIKTPLGNYKLLATT